VSQRAVVARRYVQSDLAQAVPNVPLATAAGAVRGLGYAFDEFRLPEFLLESPAGVYSRATIGARPRTLDGLGANCRRPCRRLAQTYAFSQSPLSRSSRLFIGPIVKAAKGRGRSNAERPAIVAKGPNAGIPFSSLRNCGSFRDDSEWAVRHSAAALAITVTTRLSDRLPRLR
jgi:hypothetical protein